MIFGFSNQLPWWPLALAETFTDLRKKASSFSCPKLPFGGKAIYEFMGFYATSPMPLKGDPTAKNRVWGFFGDEQKMHRENRPQTLQPHQENPPVTTRTASGRSYWPSRDPIEERGGLNVYGMVNNNTVRFFDFLGLLDNEMSSELDAARAAGELAKHKGNEWDVNNPTDDEGYSGIEFCGLICRKCIEGTDPVEYTYSFTGPVKGAEPAEVAAGNKQILEDFKKLVEAAKDYNKARDKGTPPKAIPLEPKLYGASCNPWDAPPCESLGEGWEEIGDYHSHPNDSPFSDADKNVDPGKRAWMTNGDPADPSTWRTQSIDSDGNESPAYPPLPGH